MPELANVASSGISKWVDRLMASDRDVTKLAQNQADMSAALGRASYTLDWQGTHWNDTFRHDNLATRAATLKDFWVTDKESVFTLGQMPIEPAKVGDIAAIAAEPTGSAEEEALKAKLIASQQRYSELAAKQVGVRKAIGDLNGNASFQANQWNHTTKAFADEPRAATLRSYWDQLRNGLYSVRDQLLAGTK